MLFQNSGMLRKTEHHSLKRAAKGRNGRSVAHDLPGTVCGPHPRIPDFRPTNDTVRGQVIAWFPHSITLAAPASLLSQCWAFLLFDEAIVFALNPLETVSRAVGKLSVETFTNVSPLLTKINPMVPDEVHLFFVILRPRRATALRNGR